MTLSISSSSDMHANDGTGNQSRFSDNRHHQQDQGRRQQRSLPATRTETEDRDRRRRRRQQWCQQAETVIRTLSNILIVGGAVTCLAVAVKAIAQLESVGTVVFFLLIPAVLGGSCLLALVNASWSSRQPGRRCSAVQVACNLILALITMYVEFLFWPYRRHLAFAILCAAALPMFVFINLPSVFMRDRTISSHQRRQRQQQQQDDDAAAIDEPAIQIMTIQIHSNNTFSTLSGLGDTAVLRGRFNVAGENRDQLWLQTLRFGFGRSVSGSTYRYVVLCLNRDLIFDAFHESRI